MQSGMHRPELVLPRIQWICIFDFHERCVIITSKPQRRGKN